ncbi:3-oxoacyl-synthase [Lipomyces kononenkoae]|uniref:3-oxoacyl-synthase n=1 Tax=Lipomyces kononenkoae TaxID=34357 RepID=A0ACC3SU38_LIPKO
MTSVSDEERARTHTLVLELLAHQFAYPVQWIDTQDALLGEEKIERFVEIGPSNTLTGLAKQTIQTKYQDHDTALSIRRQLLSIKQTESDIYYANGVAVEVPKQAPAKTDAKPTAPAPSPEPAAAAPAPSGAGARSIATAEDVPVKSEDIVLTIIAQKLKKSTKDISLSSNIKALVGGRSTLENEIVGDLLSEFGNLPERSEELSLTELGEALNSANAQRRLGKQTNTLVQRLIAASMPGDFSMTRVRKYLEDRWGFQVGRQDSVLLSAIPSPPKNRLGDPKEVNAYLDSLVKEYAQAAGLALEEALQQQQQSAVQVNPEAINAVVRRQEQLAEQQLKVYAQFLDVDLHADGKSAEQSESAMSALQKQLDLWVAEHGEAYASGITPVFDAKKLREYSSYWTWALQDLTATFYDISRGTLNVDKEVIADITYRLANKSSPPLVESIRYLLTQCHDEKSKAFFQLLLNTVAQSIGSIPVFKTSTNFLGPRTTIDELGNITYSEHPRSEDGSKEHLGEPTRLPHIKRKNDKEWTFDSATTALYNKAIDQISSTGLSLANKTILLTGAGRNSIGEELLKGLLAGGAQVIVTTNSFSSKTALKYQKIYQGHGSKGSKLVLVPFNQGSQQDVESLVDYIYNQKQGLGWDLDVVIPFAAISVTGRQIDEIDSKSEIAQRIMLTNTIRLLGAIKRHKEAAGYRTRPTHAILPLSPNHGVFGGDGLYSESKMALESLFAKWHSEDWSDYLSICGTSIGWTRGTGLMHQNDTVAEGVEKLGVRTFSRPEMALCILALLSRPLVEFSQEEPLYADFSGGMDKVPDFPSELNAIQDNIKSLSEIRRAVAAELALDNGSDLNATKSAKNEQDAMKKRAKIELGFPTLPNYETEIQPLRSQLDSMVSLEHTVVIVGFSELGPCGNSRTRWEMEAYDELSLEGCTEMAWIMGLIKYSKASGNKPAGWIDVKTKEPVEEFDVKKRYESYIREHTGIRLIEPTLFDKYNPEKKQMAQEIVVQEDLAPFETSKDAALSFKREHGDKVEIFPGVESDSYSVVMKKGAVIHVPKAVKFRQTVAAQIPTGWDPRTYGISDDIINQVDPVTLYTLVTTVEGLLSAGITDPYEIYKYIHVSELGNCFGSGLGGTNSSEKMYRDRLADKPVQNDILQETFLNTVGAWVNMLLLSSSGPNKTSVGACATSVESLDTAYDLILAGKAKMCFVGSVDEFSEYTSLEFSNMKATSNAETEREAGRDPKEMSRPAASSRKGFMESHGAGLHIACTAKLAIEMGLPIYGVIAFTGISSDKVGRSVPAPGKGVLSNARESTAGFPSPLLDIEYRRRQIDIRRQQITNFREVELSNLEDTILHLMAKDNHFNPSEYRAYMVKQIDLKFQMQEQDMLASFGNHFWRNHPEIAPIKGALATWGLSVDDVTVASFHGTSTVLNEKNECSIIQNQLSHLGRTKGSRTLGVFQKSVTGHPKGPASSWMLNGCLQIMSTGLVPGNRNLDNLDPGFEQYDHITFLNQNVQTTGIKAFSLTSFGFGQKGGQVIGVHPKYLFATIPKDVFDDYAKKLKRRRAIATVAFHEALLENNMFVAKDDPPYDVVQEMKTLLDPNARWE